MIQRGSDTSRRLPDPELGGGHRGPADICQGHERPGSPELERVNLDARLREQPIRI
jgi:hypothetical protein